MSIPSFEHKIVFSPISALTPYPNNARKHTKRQVKQIARSIESFGFTNPVLVGNDGQILAGHGRIEAAKFLGITIIPTIMLAHLSAAERKAYVLADNKLALNANWDQDMLAIELQGLIGLDFELELTGFSVAETDLILEGAKTRDVKGKDADLDIIPPLPTHAVTRLGDVWCLGHHTLICGDAQDSISFEALFGNEKADLIFTDPPYNVKIDGHVSGLGKAKHREFAFASGEMSDVEFTAFLKSTLSNCAYRCREGAIAYVCMDWRHMRELLEAGATAFTELKNLCVWNKTNGGMGSFYRSKHELVFVYKIGTEPHTNNFELGQHGRYRTNVWDYAGISSMSANRDEELAMHPTVKPVALVADAIKDCSKRGDIILDAFGGSGSTLIAAETCGRKARLIEYDPLYCDTIITRWQNLTGKSAVHQGLQTSFEDLLETRKNGAQS